MELHKIAGICLALLVAEASATDCFTRTHSTVYSKGVAYSAPVAKKAPPLLGIPGTYSPPIYSAPVVKKVPIVKHQKFEYIPQGSTYYSGIYNTRLDTAALAKEAVLLQKAADESYRARSKEILSFLELLARREPPEDIEARANAIAKIIEAASKAYYEKEAPVPQPTLTLTEQKCGKCHLGTDIKGGFDLAQLEPKTLIKALSAVSKGDMPPDGDVTTDERVAIINELLETIKE